MVAGSVRNVTRADVLSALASVTAGDIGPGNAWAAGLQKSPAALLALDATNRAPRRDLSSAGQVDRRQLVTCERQVKGSRQDDDMLVAGTFERGQRRDRERAGCLPVTHRECPCCVDIVRLALRDAVHRGF